MICAIIPTRSHPPELAQLLGVLAGDGVCTHLIVDTDDSRPSLHELWNDACDAAVGHGAAFLAVLGDDIAILPGTVLLFAGLLMDDPRLGVIHPDATATEWSLATRLPPIDLERPLTGSCFILNAAVGVRFDEPLHFDAAFEADLRAAGWEIGCATGIPFRQSA